LERISVATNFLNQKGQYNIILLGEGLGAVYALEHLNKVVAPSNPKESADQQEKNQDRAVRAIILLDIKTPENWPFSPPDKLIDRPNVPTLDLDTTWNLQARKAAEMRKQVSIQKGYQSYRIKSLPPQTGKNPEEFNLGLTKTIRGFLQQEAKGEELGPNPDAQNNE
jgi:hypothetical protein